MARALDADELSHARDAPSSMIARCLATKARVRDRAAGRGRGAQIRMALYAPWPPIAGEVVRLT
jgi:hypothetical protein